jgi:hypothetical protein
VSASPLLPVDEALARILAHADPVGAETVPVERAAGRVLADRGDQLRPARLADLVRLLPRGHPAVNHAAFAIRPRSLILLDVRGVLRADLL